MFPSDGLCTTTLLPNQHAQWWEVAVPIIIILILMFIGLAGLYLVGYVFPNIIRRPHPIGSANGVVRPSDVPPHYAGCHATVKTLTADRRLFTPFDLEVLESLEKYLDRQQEWWHITAPALISLVITSLLLLSTDIIFSCAWPNQRRPDINSAVQCFLVPAGFIYALTFGFVFTDCLARQKEVLLKVTEEVSMMDQILTMVDSMHLPSPEHLLAILKAVKCELVCQAMQIQHQEPSHFHQKQEEDTQVMLWSIVDVLRDIENHKEDGYELNVLITKKLFLYMERLNSICSDRLGILHIKINPLMWVFLEILGVFSVFGVILIDNKSTILDISIAHVTIFSMSILCYVMSDFDTPFNGFFRVDVSIVLDLCKKLNSKHEVLLKELAKDIHKELSTSKLQTEL